MLIESFIINCKIDHGGMTIQEYQAHLQDWHGYCADHTEWIGRDIFCFEDIKHSGQHNYTQSGFPVSSMGEVYEGYTFR